MTHPKETVTLFQALKSNAVWLAIVFLVLGLFAFIAYTLNRPRLSLGTMEAECRESGRVWLDIYHPQYGQGGACQDRE